LYFDGVRIKPGFGEQPDSSFAGIAEEVVSGVALILPSSG
jgi:hypothetical protein